MRNEERGVRKAGAEKRQPGAAAVQGAGRGEGNRTEQTDRTDRSSTSPSPQPSPAQGRGREGTLSGEGRQDCRLCQARKIAERIGYNGKVKGDTIRAHRRQMGDGRQLFAEMPRGAFFVEDRSRRRIIFAGELIRGEGRGARGEGGTQRGRFGVLYMELEHGDGSHLLRRKGAETRATLSEAMEDLWRWARGKQGPGMVIVEGEVE